ncbi:trigger factor [Candidatus Finniella inopinata]|uniref:Trigger factor n=1 Tax=Candidatus Finniella inopinata TaxID=1696036 RepID=A0A4Q7DKK4_9PROT|nr:trigger factor [Candidatus Finniella inopinata]RZI46735.1 trigger factor [Candidatus Finniella inopinata]
MQIQNRTSKGLKHEFTVTVPLQDIDERIVNWLQERAKSVRLDGFRPGKAPLNIIRQRYGDQALQEAREHFVRTGTEKIYKDQNVRVAGNPVYDFGDLEKEQDFSFSIAFETLPSFDLKDFSKIKLETLDVKVPGEEIEKSLNRLAEAYKESGDEASAQDFKIDDEFAKKFACENLEALRAKIEETLKRDYDHLARLYCKRHLLDALADDYTFDLPEAMVKSEFDAIWGRLEKEMANAKENGDLSPEEADKPMKDYEEEYRQIASRRVRLGLVVAEVAKKNNISLSPEMVRDLMVQEAMRYPGEEQEVVKYYRSHPEMIEHLTGPALEDKVVDFIVSKADVKKMDITFKELQKKLKGILPQYDDEEGAEGEALAETTAEVEKPKKAKKKTETEA